MEAWLSPDSTLRRIEFASAFARGAVPIVRETSDGLALPPTKQALSVDPKQLEEMFGSILAPETRAVVNTAPPGQRAALILGSPDFMRR
jgi:hypothetical protein